MPGHLVALSSGLRELRVGGCFDQFWQRLEDLVFRVVDVAQAMEERSSALDQRTRRGCLHRRGRHRAAQHGQLRFGDRQGESRDLHGHRPAARVRQAIHFGTVSVVGVYGGYLAKIPMGSAINRGLTFRMAQTPVQHYHEPGAATTATRPSPFAAATGW
jgi:hypothetical protein